MPGYSLLSQEGWGGVDFFKQNFPWQCFHLTPWRHPMLPPIWSSCGEVKCFCPILQHPHTLRLIVERLQFGIWVIIFGTVIGWVAWFQYKGLDVFHLFCFSAGSSKWLSCPLEKSIWFLKGKAPHALYNWVMNLIYPSLGVCSMDYRHQIFKKLFIAHSD